MNAMMTVGVLGRDRDGQQVHGEGPDDVHDAGQQRVGQAAEEAGEQGDDGGGEAAQDGRADPDQQRAPPAVQQQDGDVAAHAVPAEEVVAQVPGGPDRGLAQVQGPAALLHHRDHLPVHHRVAVQVGRERVHVRHVLRVQRRGQGQHHDQQEQAEGRQRDSVAPQPPAGQCPGVAPEVGRGRPGADLGLLKQRGHAKRARACR